MEFTGADHDELLREALILRQDLVNEIEAEGGVSPEVDQRPMEEVWASLAEQFGSQREAERAVDRLVGEISERSPGRTA
jgi:hypothetical protein